MPYCTCTLLDATVFTHPLDAEMFVGSLDANNVQSLDAKLFFVHSLEATVFAHPLDAEMSVGSLDANNVQSLDAKILFVHLLTLQCSFTFLRLKCPSGLSTLTMYSLLTPNFSSCTLLRLQCSPTLLDAEMFVGSLNANNVQSLHATIFFVHS